MVAFLWQGGIRTLGAFIAIYGYTYCFHVNFSVSACRYSPYRLHYSSCHTRCLLSQRIKD